MSASFHQPSSLFFSSFFFCVRVHKMSGLAAIICLYFSMVIQWQNWNCQVCVCVWCVHCMCVHCMCVCECVCALCVCVCDACYQNVNSPSSASQHKQQIHIIVHKRVLWKQPARSNDQPIIITFCLSPRFFLQCHVTSSQATNPVCNHLLASPTAGCVSWFQPYLA